VAAPTPPPVPSGTETLAASLQLPEPKAEIEPEPELPVGFFSDDLVGDEHEDDGIDEDEFGEDTETPSLFGDLIAEQQPAVMTVTPPVTVPVVSTPAPEPVDEPEPEPDEEEDEDAVPFFTDDDVPYSDELPVITAVVPTSVPLFPAAIPIPEDDEETRYLLSGALQSEPEAVRTPKPAAPAPPAEVEEPDDGIQLDIRQVQQVWNRFLTDAGKISKQTEVMMSKAYPTEAEGKEVTITFSERMHFERMNEPSKLQFVRKLLARCLGVENVAARFVLGDDAQPAPVRVKSGEKKALKRDPLAELLALDMVPEIAAAPPEDSFGPSSWSAPAAPPTPVPTPPRPKAVYEAPPLPVDDFRTARNPAPGTNGSSTDNSNSGSPFTAGYTAVNSGGGKSDSAAEARRAVALENPLVQETLQVFGGEIVEE
jgi:hypothetical protein